MRGARASAPADESAFSSSSAAQQERDGRDGGVITDGPLTDRMGYKTSPTSKGSGMDGRSKAGGGNVKGKGVAGLESGGLPLPIDLERGSALSQAATAAAGLPRTVGVVALAGLAFVTICAGPFGIEEAVHASGPLPVAGAVVALAVLWGLPQALMCAELSTMIDENGGYVLWVDRAMGPFAAWLCAFNSLGSNMTDLPLYCILFASYSGVLLKQAMGMGDQDSLPGWAVYLLKCGCLLVMTGLNLRNISSVGVASALVTCIILAPFLLEIGFAWKYQSLDDWTGVARPMDWGTFTSTLLWNMQGWDSIGTMAGEVKDSARTYPTGIIIALVIITLTYVVPVLVGAGVEPDPANWTEGALSVVAARVAPWLGLWVGLGAAAAQLGNGVAMMAASSRVTWQMSKSSMLPSQLGCMWAATSAPAAAVIMHGITTAGLMLLPFRTLVTVDTIFNNVSLLLEGAAFLVLRYTEPDTMRPYEVPGGLVVAWIITISKTCVILFAIGTAGWVKWVACLGANLLFILAYFVLERCKRDNAKGIPVGESRRLLEEKAAYNLRRALVDVARGDIRAAEAASVGAVMGVSKESLPRGVGEFDQEMP